MKTYSFIIPHRNTPDLLQRLINTIPQREDIEIIVVDDNSDEGKKANVVRSDVQLIFLDSNKSKGAGHARNVGMDRASGKWLLFADADDLYKEGFIEILDEYKDDDIEMLFYNIESVDCDTLQPGKINRAKLYNILLAQYNGSKTTTDELLFMGYSPWYRMVKASYVRHYGIRYEEIVKGNDCFFAFQISYFAKRWAVDKRSVYIITYNSNSLTYGKYTLFKIQTTLNNLIHRRRFNIFIGHPEWNKHSIRGNNVNNPIMFICSIIKKNPILGLRAIFYYVTHYIEIKRNANFYVDTIKIIEEKVK